jgi:hypothetical protein
MNQGRKEVFRDEVVNRVHTINSNPRISTARGTQRLRRVIMAVQVSDPSPLR